MNRVVSCGGSVMARPVMERTRRAIRGSSTVSRCALAAACAFLVGAQEAEVLPDELTAGAAAGLPFLSADGRGNRGTPAEQARQHDKLRRVASQVKCDVCQELTADLLYEGLRVQNQTSRSTFKKNIGPETHLTELVDQVCGQDMKPLGQSYQLVECKSALALEGEYRKRFPPVGRYRCGERGEAGFVVLRDDRALMSPFGALRHIAAGKKLILQHQMEYDVLMAVCSEYIKPWDELTEDVAGELDAAAVLFGQRLGGELRTGSDLRVFAPIADRLCQPLCGKNSKTKSKKGKRNKKRKRVPGSKPQ